MSLDLVGRLDQAMRSKFERPVIDREKTLRPTEASIEYETPSGRKAIAGKCMRSVWYRLKGVPETETPQDRMYWVWWSGKAWESKCMNKMKEEGILVTANPRFLYKHPDVPLLVSGEFDAIAYDKELGCNVLIEYKTTGGSYIGRIKLMGNSKHRPEPKIENLMQVMLYLDRVRETVPYGVIAYLIRDKMERVQFTVALREEGGLTFPIFVQGTGDLSRATALKHINLEGIYARYAKTCEHYLSDILPDRDYTLEYTDDQALLLFQDGDLSKKQYDDHVSGKSRKGDWQCNYCSYLSTCWEESR